MPSPRPTSTASGGWSTAPCWPRASSLLRIATGRDAADTAFLDNFGGAITFNNATVTAVVKGDLPATIRGPWSLSAETGRRLP